MSNVIRLGDYITEISEKTTVNNQHMVLTSSQEGIVSQDDYFNKQVASKDNTGYKIIRRGQFTYRAMSDTGRFYINRLTDYDIGIVSPAYPVFELRTNGQILPEYLQEYFHSEHFQNAITLSSTGSTRVSLKLAKIADLRIDIPTLPKQQCAVQAISHVNHLISMQNSSAAKLDQLVKSRFVEMFGNRGENPFGFPTIAMGNVYKFQYGKGNNIPEDKGDYPCYGSNGIVGHHTECNSEDSPIIGHIGAYAGIVNWGKGKHYVTYNGVICKLINDQVNPVYGYYLLQIQDYNAVAKSGAAQPFVSYKDLDAPVANIPPLELQNRFAAFVEQTDKSKLSYEMEVAA